MIKGVLIESYFMKVASQLLLQVPILKIEPLKAHIVAFDYN